MKQNLSTTVQTLKENLNSAIQKHNYNLLDEEVLRISTTLDQYLNSSFLKQINNK